MSHPSPRSPPFRRAVARRLGAFAARARRAGRSGLGQGRRRQEAVDGRMPPVAGGIPSKGPMAPRRPDRRRAQGMEEAFETVCAGGVVLRLGHPRGWSPPRGTIIRRFCFGGAQFPGDSAGWAAGRHAASVGTSSSSHHCRAMGAVHEVGAADADSLAADGGFPLPVRRRKRGRRKTGAGDDTGGDGSGEDCAGETPPRRPRAPPAPRRWRTLRLDPQSASCGPRNARRGGSRCASGQPVRRRRVSRNGVSQTLWADLRRFSRAAGRADGQACTAGP